MYHLIKIKNARTNVPEPMRLALSAAVTVDRGLPVTVKNGLLTVCNDKSTVSPTHITLAAVENEPFVLCYEVTPDMVFETAVTASPAAVRLGTEYLLSADGASMGTVAVSGSLRGATVVGMNGAKRAGDKLLVSFR